MGREGRLQAQLNQARNRAQEVADRAREREEMHEKERLVWESKHQAATARAERAEAAHGEATAESTRAWSARGESQALHGRAEERCARLEQTMEEMHRKVANMEADREDKLTVMKNMAHAQVEARWLVRKCPRSALAALPHLRKA